MDLSTSECAEVNPSHPDPGRREKISLKFLFSHFFVVLQKVLCQVYLTIGKIKINT